MSENLQPEEDAAAEAEVELASTAANFVAMHAARIREHLEQRNHWMRVMYAEGASCSQIATASGLTAEECRVIVDSQR